MDEYLTVRELSERIKLARQTIYNFIHLGKFEFGKHYLKPTPKKILFRWTEIREWMGENYAPAGEPADGAVPGPIPVPGAKRFVAPARPRATRQAKSRIVF